MARFSRSTGRRPAHFSDQSSVNGLTLPNSCFVRTLAIASSSGLVIASAGFGAVFAWASGSAHGIALGALSVLMALALEIAKPLAVSAALTAFRSWRLMQGLLLAALGLIAIVYSLSAELSLIATTRGDKLAERAALSDTAAMAKARYVRASAELASLPSARPTGELQAGISALLRTPGAGDCTKIDGAISRKVCPKVDALRAELARAQRRIDLGKILDDAEKDGTPSVGAADPGAAALAAYLGIFGVKVDPALLTDLLILVGVLALEVGSALAGLLVTAVSGNGVRPPGAGVPNGHPAPSPGKARQVFQAPNLAPDRRSAKQSPDPRPEPERAPTALGEALMDHLRDRGGLVHAGQRALARMLGTSTTEMHRVIHALAAAGLIDVAADRFAGTTLKLAA